jgi:hypothetical protein
MLNWTTLGREHIQKSSRRRTRVLYRDPPVATGEQVTRGLVRSEAAGACLLTRENSGGG